MPGHVGLEQQLVFALGIFDPISIQAYGRLMQVSKSVKDAVTQWEAPLFESQRVVNLLRMARTTKKSKGRDTLAKSYYVCQRTWLEWPLSRVAKFYIPIRNYGCCNKKKSAKEILRDYVIYMQWWANNNNNNNRNLGVVSVELRRSIQTASAYLTAHITGPPH